MTHMTKDGHINNYVLTVEELTAYAEELKILRTVVEGEYNSVAQTLRVLTTKQPLRSYESYPMMHSLSSALEFFLRLGKRKLAITALLNKVTERGKHDAAK